MLADARATGWSRRQIPPKHQHAQMLIADMTVNLLRVESRQVVYEDRRALLQMMG